MYACRITCFTIGQLVFARTSQHQREVLVRGETFEPHGMLGC